MADVHNKRTRSYNMSQIKGKNTKPELMVRKFLYANGFRYRIHVKNLQGKPDIVLRKYRTIIDIRGCFWHSHSNCRFGDNVSTSSEKITSRRRSAVERDIIKMKKWKADGWKVIIVWADCQLEPRRKKSKVRERTLLKIINELKGENTCN